MLYKYLTYWVINKVQMALLQECHPLAPQAWDNVQIFFKSDKKDKCKDLRPHDWVWN